MAAVIGYQHIRLVADASRIKGLEDQITGLDTQIEEAGRANKKLTDDLAAQNKALSDMATLRDEQVKAGQDALAALAKRPPSKQTAVINNARALSAGMKGDYDATQKLIDDFVTSSRD